MGATTRSFPMTEQELYIAGGLVLNFTSLYAVDAVGSFVPSSFFFGRCVSYDCRPPSQAPLRLTVHSC